MKKSGTGIRGRQSALPAPRHLPLVAILVDAQAELQELGVASGLKVLAAMLEADRVAVCGQRYAHQPARRASRAGYAPSDVVLGGRKVARRRPRVRRDGQEVALPSVQACTNTDPLTRRVVEQLRIGVATRQYGRSLEPLGADVRTRGTSKSAVSRRCVAQTQAHLDAWRATPLDALERVALLIDGVHVGGHCIVVALGLDNTGATHPLGLWEGSAEHTTVCQGLLTNLQSRGLRTDRRLLVILDGAQALHTAVTQTLRPRSPGTTMPGAEAAQRARVSARGPASVGEGDPHARLYAHRRPGGPAPVAGPGPAGGRRLSECSRQHTGRARRDAHRGRVAALGAAPPIAGDDQRRREPPEPDTPREAERETLARGYDGAPLGRCRCAGSGQRIPAGEGV